MYECRELLFQHRRLHFTATTNPHQD